MGWTGRVDRRFGGLAMVPALGAILALSWAAFSPGSTTYDSAVQLAQGRSGQFDDWHPPLFAFVWGLLDSIVPGPAGMLALNLVLFWGGFGLVVHRCLHPIAAAPGLLAVALFPPAVSILGVIWKDVSVGAALVLGTGLLLTGSVRRSRLLLALALLPLTFAAAVRHDGAFAAGPLAVAVGVHLARERSARVRGLAGAAAVSLVIGVAWLAPPALLHPNKSFPIQQILSHDLAGLSAASGRSLFPDSSVPVERIQMQYSPIDIYSSLKGLPAVRNEGELCSLKRAWLDAVRRDPRTYLRNRWQLFRRLFGIGGPAATDTYYFGTEPPLGSGTTPFVPNRLSRIAEQYFERSHNWLVFRGWVAAAILACFLFLGLTPWLPVRNRWAVISICASGLAYALPHFATSPVSDFRLIWWVYLAAILAPLAAFARVWPGEFPPE
jgi:hypothetical protein